MISPWQGFIRNPQISCRVEFGYPENRFEKPIFFGLSQQIHKIFNLLAEFDFDNDTYSMVKVEICSISRWNSQ
jgi:hypothetical protein